MLSLVLESVIKKTIEALRRLEIWMARRCDCGAACAASSSSMARAREGRGHLRSDFQFPIPVSGQLQRRPASPSSSQGEPVSTGSILDFLVFINYQRSFETLGPSDCNMKLSKTYEKA